MTPAERWLESVDHHKAWAAYTLSCAAEHRASAVRASLCPFGAAEDRAAEVARYEGRIAERLAEHAHHLRMAAEYAALDSAGGDAREEAASAVSGPYAEASPCPPTGDASAVPLDAPRRWPAAHEFKAVQE